jgi:hypothetical protein
VHHFAKVIPPSYLLMTAGGVDMSFSIFVGDFPRGKDFPLLNWVKGIFSQR